MELKDTIAFGHDSHLSIEVNDAKVRAKDDRSVPVPDTENNRSEDCHHGDQLPLAIKVK